VPPVQQLLPAWFAARSVTAGSFRAQRAITGQDSSASAYLAQHPDVVSGQALEEGPSGEVVTEERNAQVVGSVGLHDVLTRNRRNVEGWPRGPAMLLAKFEDALSVSLAEGAGSPNAAQTLQLFSAKEVDNDIPQVAVLKRIPWTKEEVKGSSQTRSQVFKQRHK